MKHVSMVILFIVLFLVSSPVPAQMLPVTTTSEEARIHFERGRHAAFHYQFEQAIRHLDAAIAADSAFVLAYLHRGGSSGRYERKRYFDLAHANRDRVSEGEQRMIDAFFAFLWDGDIERAISIFHDLASEYKDDPYLPAYLGLRYYRNLNRYDEAKEQFERALKRDSSFVQAYNWLGYVALDQEDYQAAEKAFRRYIELAPDQPRPYDSLGELFRRLGRYDYAAVQFELAISNDPAFIESREKLARIHIMSSNEQFKAAAGRSDSQAIASFYTANGQLLQNGSGVIEGTDAITRFWQKKFDSGLTGVERESLEIFLGAYYDVVTETGRYTFTDGGGEIDTGNYIVIWVRTPDGWKLYRDIQTSGRPPGE